MEWNKMTGLTNRKEVIFALASVTLSFLFLFLVLEIFLHIVAWPMLPRLLAANNETPIARVRPNQDYVYAHYWFLRHKTKNHSNNYGYINDIYYDASIASPLLAVIGDSIVEANHVSHTETINGPTRICARGNSKSLQFWSFWCTSKPNNDDIEGGCVIGVRS